MMTRVFLGLFGLFSVPYGIYCFVRPGFLEMFAGVAAVSTTGTVELRAMYGGLQTGFGALALLGAFRPTFAPTALLATAFLCAGLGLFRLMGALAAGEVSSYTAQGLIFEFGASVAAAALWRRWPSPAPHCCRPPASGGQRTRVDSPASRRWGVVPSRAAGSSMPGPLGGTNALPTATASRAMWKCLLQRERHTYSILEVA